MTSAVAAARERSFQEFETELKRLARTLPQETVTIVVRRMALFALRRVVLRTPVDTGRARANWQVTIGVPADGILAGFDKGGNAAIQAGSSVINSEEARAKLYVFPTIWLSNNLPYAIVLEDGGYPLSPKRGTYVKERRGRSGRKTKAHYEIRSSGGFSRQAPNGMVAVTVQELLAQFSEP